MREVTAYGNPESFYQNSPDFLKKLIDDIRQQKRVGIRKRPSESILDKSSIFKSSDRSKLIDKIALLVDENIVGRSEMCFQFSDLLNRSLNFLKINSKSVVGTAIYYKNRAEIFRWQHSWVRVGHEVIDANVDSLFENPLVDSRVKVDPYWGPLISIPSDRRLKENFGQQLPMDSDVENIWWPELKNWLLDF